MAELHASVALAAVVSPAQVFRFMIPFSPDQGVSGAQMSLGNSLGCNIYFKYLQIDYAEPTGAAGVPDA